MTTNGADVENGGRVSRFILIVVAIVLSLMLQLAAPLGRVSRWRHVTAVTQERE
jgi:hypothetical protein